VLKRNSFAFLPAVNDDGSATSFTAANRRRNCRVLQEAVERALEDNAKLKAQMGEAALRRARAVAAKELGNDAFKAKDFAEAARQYTAAIAADNTDATYYSNRCAALPFTALQCGFCYCRSELTASAARPK
jgi:hypothetical protein